MICFFYYDMNHWYVEFLSIFTFFYGYDNIYILRNFYVIIIIWCIENNPWINVKE